MVVGERQRRANAMRMFPSLEGGDNQRSCEGISFDLINTKFVRVESFCEGGDCPREFHEEMF